MQNKVNARFMVKVALILTLWYWILFIGAPLVFGGPGIYAPVNGNDDGQGFYRLIFPDGLNDSYLVYYVIGMGVAFLIMSLSTWIWPRRLIWLILLLGTSYQFVLWTSARTWDVLWGAVSQAPSTPSIFVVVLLIILPGWAYIHSLRSALAKS